MVMAVVVAAPLYVYGVVLMRSSSLYRWENEYASGPGLECRRFALPI